jgi:NADH dehydrogenase FAD-containing subunit
MPRNSLLPGATRVVVIGAGYAGLIATNRFLGSLTEDEQQRTAVTVVNPRPDFIERIRLHELAAGARNTVTIPLHSVLHRGAATLLGRATRIDSTGQTVQVTTENGTVEVAYDYLVYAVGSVASAQIPGALEHAFLVGDYEGALGAAEAITAAGATPRITVVGGGFTGVETASELAEQYPYAEVTLRCSGRLVKDMRPAARRSLLKTLTRLGVAVEEDSAVAEIESGKLRLTSGVVHALDVCVVAASFEVPDVAAVSGLPVDGDNRLKVDEHLRSLAAPNVIGAGDAIVAPPEVARHLRMGCAVALPLGGQAAETLLAATRGTPLPTLSIGFVLQCISLGRKKSYIQVVRADDTPRSIHFGGRAGAMIKEKICTMVVDSPKKESTSPGHYAWPKGPKRTSAA